MEYIVQLENLSYTRRWVRLPQLTYSKKTRSIFGSRVDKMRGVDYDSQEKLVNELHEALQLDPDGGSKVEHYCILQQKR